MKRRASIFVGLVVLLAVGAGAASANSAPCTRGDAVALFNAGSTGRIRGEGAPADRSARIGPGPAFNGFHVCAEDWHVLFINLITTDATDGPRTVGEARILAAAVEVTYELDGAPLPVERTPVKPWLGEPTTLAPDATVAFSYHTGAVLAPDALALVRTRNGFASTLTAFCGTTSATLPSTSTRRAPALASSRRPAIPKESGT